MPSCPISTERIDERAARIVGLLVLLTVAAHFLHPSILWLLLLLLDFTARSFYRPASPFARLSRCIVARFGEARIVDAAPKIFAARIGLILTIGALTAWGTRETTLAQTLLGIMGICAFFEAAFGYCVGCKFYTLWRKIKGKN